MNYSIFFIVLVFAVQIGQAGNNGADKNVKIDSPPALDPTLPPSQKHEPPFDPSKDSGLHVSATTHWAGATIDMPRGDNNGTGPAIGSFKAEWNVPKLCLREGQNIQSANTLHTWIGISGKECSPKGAMLLAGIKTTLQNDGTTTAAAWFGWYPSISIVDFGDVEGEKITNRHTNHVTRQTVYSTVPSVDDFPICGDKDGRAWVVVEGPFSQAFPTEQDPSDVVTFADGIPGFDDVSFRLPEVRALDRLEARSVRGDSAALYTVADNQGVVVNADTFGTKSFRVYTSQSCVK
ncbi:hypothetical protein NUW58_g3622 [Xylaria curta]|uniref:Uncharacterized protein n=1 Tax=Xylaria curta TaxID=42375 RepID=A0ACC1PBN2_9PEZI|nr:hypothetical protein NUW58_g3622 [Xylaria curta]